MKIIHLLSACLLCCVLTVNAQQKIIDWNYPVLPGSEEWKNFTSYVEKLEVCQIPDDILKQLSTEQLVALCLDFPLLFDVYSYNTVLEGTQRIANRFNGLQELLSRKDNSTYLLKRLKQLKTEEFTEYMTEVEIGDKINKQTILETLFSFDDVLKNISTKEQQELADVAMVNLTTKISMPEYFGTASIGASARLLAKVIEPMNKQNIASVSPAYQRLLSHGIIYDTVVIGELKAIYQTLKQQQP